MALATTTSILNRMPRRVVVRGRTAAMMALGSLVLLLGVSYSRLMENDRRQTIHQLVDATLDEPISLDSIATSGSLETTKALEDNQNVEEQHDDAADEDDDDDTTTQDVTIESLVLEEQSERNVSQEEVRMNQEIILGSKVELLRRATVKELTENEDGSRGSLPSPPSEIVEGNLPFPHHYEKNRKYFMYQPSGGWGNQRFILRWAMIAANAMNRTLVVAPLAAHSDIWHGYDDFKPKELLSAARVLDVEALKEAVERGVVFLNDSPSRAADHVANFTKLSLMRYVKPHYKYYKDGTKRDLWLMEDDIREEWGAREEDVIFWHRGSMWKCCRTLSAGDYVWLARHIIFNRWFKTLALRLMSAFPDGYNAVHVRRSDHVSKDRRSAEQYYKYHDLASFDKSLPLYVATDEQDPRWFAYFTRTRRRFRRMIFWRDLHGETISRALAEFPPAMHGDVLGFIEQLVCGNAVRWEGSLKSTFSAAIATIRQVPALRELKYSFLPMPSKRKAKKNDEEEGVVDEEVR